MHWVGKMVVNNTSVKLHALSLTSIGTFVSYTAQVRGYIFMHAHYFKYLQEWPCSVTPIALQIFAPQVIAYCLHMLVVEWAFWDQELLKLDNLAVLVLKGDQHRKMTS